MPACHGSPQPRQHHLQNFKLGSPFTSSASVKTLMLCHALASDSRLSSAKRGYCTASLPWIVPIPGTTKLSRLEEDIAAASLDLSPSDLSDINQAISKVPVEGD